MFRVPGDNVQRVAVVLSALFLCLPCLISGIPSYGDAATHVQYQHSFSSQFWGGDIYPRWLMASNKGYGSPIFVLQYPLPYWITALIRPFVRFENTPAREAKELGVFCFLAVAAAGLAARRWFGLRFGPLASTTAALVYMALPYLLAQNLYRSAAIGQLSAAVWLPLALAECGSLKMQFPRIATLGIVIALLVLSNVIMAVLCAPLLVGYMFACREGRTPHAVRAVALSLSFAVAVCLASFYLFPVIAYRHLFDLAAMARNLPGFEVSHNFSFVRWSSLARPVIALAVGSACIFTAAAAYAVWRRHRSSTPWRSVMLILLGLGATMAVPGVGLAVIRASGLKMSPLDVGDLYPEQMLATGLSTFALGVLGYCYLEQHNGWRDQVLLAAAGISLFLMLPWSASLWRAAPSIAAAIQFPHRFGEILSLVVAGIYAAAVDSCVRSGSSKGLRSAIFVTSVAMAVVIAGFVTWRADRSWVHGLRTRAALEYDAEEDLDGMYRTYVPSDHLASFTELMGTALNSYRVEHTRISDCSPQFIHGEGILNRVSWNGREFLVAYTASQESVLRIPEVYSPVWRGVLLGEDRPVRLRSSAQGLIEASLDPGRHDLSLLFDLGWPQKYGLVVTVLSLAILLGGALRELCVSNGRFGHGVAPKTETAD